MPNCSTTYVCSYVMRLDGKCFTSKEQTSPVYLSCNLLSEEGCQIFLGTTYQNGEKYTK
jgi:hypothetical protein